MQEIAIVEGDRQIQHHTERIIQNQKEIKQSFWEIGERLVKIRDLIKENKSSFSSFEQYFYEQGFEFSHKHAIKIMKIVTDFSDIRDYAAQVNLGRLIEITYVPDKELREELVKEVIEKNLTQTEIRKKVKALKKSKIGEPPDYIPEKDLDEKENIEEYRLKIKRDAENLINEMKSIEQEFSYLEQKKSDLIETANLFIERVSSKFPEEEILEEVKKVLNNFKCLGSGICPATPKRIS
jgi:hypothetical protein